MFKKFKRELVEPREPKEPRVQTDIGEILKVVGKFVLGLIIVFSFVQSVYSLEEDEYAVI